MNSSEKKIWEEAKRKLKDFSSVHTSKISDEKSITSDAEISAEHSTGDHKVSLISKAAYSL